LCLLERLQDSLRRRDIWLENSDRWGDPRRSFFRERMAGSADRRMPGAGHPTDGGNAVKQLATELDETWKTVASRFELNAAVSICHQGKYPSLTISSLEKLEEPQPLILLNSRVRQLVPLLI
jgi:hypothetical protein